ANLKTGDFLAHSAVPVAFTEEDFEQVAGGNYLVKVIYLPYPQYADVATTGPDEIVSTRLEPGQDPIAEACKRGSIMAIIRLGNIDLEAPHTPPMDAPNPFGQGPGCVGQAGPGMPPMMAGGMGGMPMMGGPGGPMMGGPGMPMMGGMPMMAGPGVPMMPGPGMPMMPGGQLPPNMPQGPVGVPAKNAPQQPAPGTGPIGKLP